jgi:hypothetical protein
MGGEHRSQKLPLEKSVCWASFADRTSQIFVQGDGDQFMTDQAPLEVDRRAMERIEWGRQHGLKDYRMTSNWNVI